MNRRRLRLIAATITVVVLVSAVATLVRDAYLGPITVTAHFQSATGIYPGDEVRISGVRVGTIESIEPDGSQATMTLAIDRELAVPAEAKAVIVAQSLLSSRYVQLSPGFTEHGPTLRDGSVIAVDHTAVPVEWDEVKTQLTRLATELGPKEGSSSTSVSHFIDSTAAALDGNGDKLRHTLAELSGVGRILAGNGGNIVEILKNLQTFVAALRDSTVQIVQFEGRLATLSSVLNDNSSTLDAALTDISGAVADVQRFVAANRDGAAEQIQRLANVTQNLVDHRIDLENILHVAPNAFANVYNAYNPDTGTTVGSFALNNFSSPVSFLCSAIGAIQNATAPETAKLCAQYLGPALQTVNFNYLPFPLNPYLAKSASPSNLIYTEPGLAPGGQGGSEPEPGESAPAVSAYTGLQDNPWPMPTAVPEPFTGRPAGTPPPGAVPQYPGAPPAAPPNMPQDVDELLLPAEAPPAPPVPAGESVPAP